MMYLFRDTILQQYNCKTSVPLCTISTIAPPQLQQQQQQYNNSGIIQVNLCYRSQAGTLPPNYYYSQWRGEKKSRMLKCAVVEKSARSSLVGIISQANNGDIYADSIDRSMISTVQRAHVQYLQLPSVTVLRLLVGLVGTITMIVSIVQYCLHHVSILRLAAVLHCTVLYYNTVLLL